MPADAIITGTDFVSIPTTDLDRSANVLNPVKMGIGHFSPDRSHISPAFSEDPDGNLLTLRHRYAPRAAA